MYPGQTSALEQYPMSGMNIPQVDAIRRARSQQKMPLYSMAEEVMSGVKPMAEAAMNTKPGIDGRVDPRAKPGLDPNARFMGGSKPMSDIPMNTKPARMGAPSGRGMPGIPGPAPRIRETR